MKASELLLAAVVVNGGRVDTNQLMQWQMLLIQQGFLIKEGYRDKTGAYHADLLLTEKGAEYVRRSKVGVI